MRCAIVLSLLLGATAFADPMNGARPGETLQARIERLRMEIEEREVALRLSLQEVRVNAQQERKGRRK